MSSASVGFNCSVRKCKRVGYVSVREMIKAGKELRPSGWYYIDIGVEGEDSFLFCDKHSKEWKDVHNSALRDFAEATTEVTT